MKGLQATNFCAPVIEKDPCWLTLSLMKCIVAIKMINKHGFKQYTMLTTFMIEKR